VTMVQLLFPSYQSARANPRCAWCIHLDAGIGQMRPCNKFSYTVYKIRSGCRAYKFIDEPEFGNRITITKQNYKRHARNWRHTHPEQRRAAQARYIKRHPDKKHENYQRYYRRHRDEILEKAKIRYRIKHPQGGVKPCTY
jgi:hypothetical protein